MQGINIITQIILPISLAFMMFSLGLELTILDFKRVVKQPQAFIVDAISQILLLPLVAFGLLSVWLLDPALAVCVMIIAACPGGVTSNLLTYLARGDSALLVCLTAIISLLCVFTLPLTIGLSIDYFMGIAIAPKFSIWGTISGVFAITTVPVYIGMFVKKTMPGFAIRFGRQARIISSILFGFIVIGAVFAEKENIIEYFEAAGPIVLTLNVIMMSLATVLSKFSNLEGRQRITITLECGLQNGTLTIFVTLTLIGNATMMVPGGIYSLLMFGSAIAYTLFMKRHSS